MTDVDGDPVPGSTVVADVHHGRALLDLLAARLAWLQVEFCKTATVRDRLIAEMAQHDSGPLTCTASFVDVGELT